MCSAGNTDKNIHGLNKESSSWSEDATEVWASSTILAHAERKSVDDLACLLHGQE